MIKTAPTASAADPATLGAYLESLEGRPVSVTAVAPLGGFKEGESKQYGYGIPLRIDYRVDGRPRRAVLSTMKPGPFGHEHRADRAQAMIWAHDAFNRLPRHARSLDVGAFRRDGELVSLGDAEEYFMLMEFIDGAEYAEDVKALERKRVADPLDRARSDALCGYLVGIHGRSGGDPGLYARRIRELVGHGECIMGLTDSYPARHGFITSKLLESIEHRCLEWRWKLKDRTHRLRQVHGDFHPWNILFRKGGDFSVLDRSRGEWGEPADDVTCLTMNYLFAALLGSGRPVGAGAELFRRFWTRYLEESGDAEILEVAAPFFAFRGLVLASPLWYPTLTESARQRIMTFVERVLEAPRFDPDHVSEYCGA